MSTNDSHVYTHEDDPKFCNAEGRLSDADVIKMQNMAMLDRDVNWDAQQLTCGLPEGHDIEQHIALVASQGFGDGLQSVWWASWLDMDGLRDEAALFVGPECDARHEGFACLLLRGHTTPDDQRHVLA
ncbi:hypothetical protein ACN2WE_04855 [Streptomyces sp. cg28]|uniref:hypothetical protein n=1 Tax=Streptomyces sp. cg28 TaxID=3403457 RepID=UPI003B21AD67